MGISRGADPGSNSPNWPICFALTTLALNYMMNHGPAEKNNSWQKNWWGVVSGAGHFLTPCDGPPFVVPGEINRAARP